MDDAALLAAIDRAAQPLLGAEEDWDALVAALGEADVVLLGEGSHGTHDFYEARAAITRRLIAEHGFAAVAAEADWPDAYRTNRYVHGRSTDEDAEQALSDFRRFPQWMWRNADVLDFVGWLREWNEPRLVDDRAGFYGLDLYSLHASMRAVLDYLDRTDRDAAARARARYACFERVGGDPHVYARAAAFGESCEDEVVAELLELRERRVAQVAAGGFVADDERFAVEQNALVVRSAERYYRAMFEGGIATWNLRDTHMAQTLDALRHHLGRRRPARIVVWAHNSHLGDARATEMGRAGELNVGQLARERYGGRVLAVGFTTYSGTVSAASDWDEPVHRMRVRPALPSSYEALFHRARHPRFLLDLRDLGEAAGGLVEERLERAIGVIYRPDTERASHYFGARLPRQFDFVVHLDETRATEPLERTALWEAGEEPETFPTGF